MASYFGLEEGIYSFAIVYEECAGRSMVHMVHGPADASPSNLADRFIRDNRIKATSRKIAEGSVKVSCDLLEYILSPAQDMIAIRDALTHDTARGYLNGFDIRLNGEGIKR